jgi:hypothetical protein
MVKNDGVQFVGVMPLSDLSSGKAINILLLGLWIVFKLPNLRQLFQAYRPTCDETISEYQSEEKEKKQFLQDIAIQKIKWQPSKKHAWVIGILFAIALLNLNHASEFLYFQF